LFVNLRIEFGPKIHLQVKGVAKPLAAGSGGSVHS
jgi:hypothetical protein